MSMGPVFVHGVPDTGALWKKVRASLPAERRGRAVSLPGFGAPLPDAFDASMDAYADWLRQAVLMDDAPVDLVGHDWGGLLVMRLASLYPDRVRTWVAGGVVIHPDYVWHEMAQAWQAPGVGEEIMALTDADAMVAALVEARVPEADARIAAGHIDETMKDCVLKLYRSASDISARWTQDIGALNARGRVIFGAHDPYCDWRLGEQQAARAGAAFTLFDACGHWWPLERPKETAALLLDLWDAAPS